MNIRRLLAASALACATLATTLLPSLAHAETVATPLEAAGRLRAMPQRLAKMYLQTRLNIERESATQRIDEGIRQFDAHLALLKNSKLEGAPARALDKVAEQWATMRSGLTELPDDAMSQTLSTRAEQVAAAAHTLTTQLLALEETPAQKLADIAMRNDMLAQRLARLFMQLKAGHAQQAQQTAMEQTRKEFLSALEQLDRAPQTAQSIKSNLDLARQQWGFFELAAGTKGYDESAVRQVATTSERISEVMTNVAAAYRRQARAQVASSK